MKGKFLYAELTVGEIAYRVKSNPKGWFKIPFGYYSYEISELGFKVDCREKYFSTSVRTETKAVDEVNLAIIVLFHFARIYKWRES